VPAGLLASGAVLFRMSRRRRRTAAEESASTG
jgi:hypothetical protein